MVRRDHSGNKPHVESKLGWPSSLAAHLEAELRVHFGAAWISGYEPLIPQMANHEKDRHVLAAAAHSHTSIILTLNLRHFRPEHLKRWGIRALHPQSVLGEIFRQEQMLVVKKLEPASAPIVVGRGSFAGAPQCRQGGSIPPNPRHSAAGVFTTGGGKDQLPWGFARGAFRVNCSHAQRVHGNHRAGWALVCGVLRRIARREWTRPDSRRVPRELARGNCAHPGT